MTKPEFRFLAADDIARIQEASLDVLRDPGVRIMTEEARAMLLEAGATLAGGEDTISLPRELVERSLASAPRRITIFDRHGEPRLFLGAGNCYAAAGVTDLYYLDPATDERREYTLDDIATATRVADALDDIDLVSTPGVVKGSSEIPVELANQHEFLRMVTNTSKPLMVLIADGDSLTDILEMAAEVVGGREVLHERPFVFPYLNTVSPLVLNPETIDKLLVAVDNGVPVVCQAAPQVGATSPITVAGSVVISLAESLAGLVLSQLRREGAAFISGVVPFIMDMRSANVSSVSPDALAFQAALTDVCKDWGLPTVGVGAGGSDAKIIDEQVGIDAAYLTLGAFLSGVDITFDAGELECGLTWSPVELVISAEVVRMCRLYAQGIEVSDETLAVEAIRTVGPGEHFLAHPDTLARFRGMWMPELLSWEPRSQWEEAGSPTLGERARRRTLEVIDTHVPEPLPEGVVEAMQAVIERRRALLPEDDD